MGSSCAANTGIEVKVGKRFHCLYKNVTELSEVVSLNSSLQFLFVLIAPSVNRIDFWPTDIHGNKCS